MSTVRAAFYARVSSEQQAAAHTIESQTSALSERARSDGTPVPPERQFVDDGISGATLVRPALDRLRDLATVGAIDKVYVHSPDRLARNYAYQVLLLDECELAATIGPVLADANWHRRREIIRTLVQKVEIGHENIKIVFRLLPEAGRSETQSIAVTLPR